MGGGNQITDMNMKPEWLQEVLKEQKQSLEDYISLNDLAKMVKADNHSFARYVRNIGVEPVKLNMSDSGRLVLCVTKIEAKEIVKHRIKEGYLI